MIPPDVFLGISTFMMRKVKISDVPYGFARVCPGLARGLPGSVDMPLYNLWL